MALRWTEVCRLPVVFVRLFSGAPGSGADFGMRLADTPQQAAGYQQDAIRMFPKASPPNVLIGGSSPGLAWIPA